jgi:hypothetical protein
LCGARPITKGENDCYGLKLCPTVRAGNSILNHTRPAHQQLVATLDRKAELLAGENFL